MPQLTWDQTGERLYETGSSKGVLFVMGTTGTYGAGVAWNGLSGVTESPTGAEETAIYADNIKYLSLTSAEEFAGTITAYTYPDEFGACDGSAEVTAGLTVGQQTRRAFGMAYSTIVGNDVEGNDYGEKIHLIYGAKVTPSERAYGTVNDTPEAINFSWAFTTTPVEVPGFKPSAYLVIDSTKVPLDNFEALKAVLYGTDGSSGKTSKLPLPSEVIELLGGTVTP